MKRIVILLLSTVSLQLSAFAQGPLTPPGPPAPTMKTLAQVEPRTPITNAAAVTISASGSYYLTTNITVSSGNGITITADNVTLDLNGFTISSTAPTASTDMGIQLSGGRANIIIINGFITSGVTVSGGIFSGSGFGSGIDYTGTAPEIVHVSRLIVSGCLRAGIYLNGNETSVDFCTVNMAGITGIFAQYVTDSTAVNCGSDAGINATHTVNNCYGNSINGGNGILGTFVNNSSGVSVTGYGLYGVNVYNSNGASTSGTGLYANNVVDNCTGNSAGGGDGVLARTAHNCSGSSTNGNGIEATVANNCYGSTYSASGVYVINAENCYGYSYGSGTGINVTGIATACTGYSAAGTGLMADIANASFGTSAGGGAGVSVVAVATGCHGVSYAGDGLKATLANNCRGTSSSGGIGVNVATIAFGCQGDSLNGIGLSCYSTNNRELSYGTAIACRGISSTYLGLYTGRAAFCSAVGGNSVGLNALGDAEFCDGYTTNPNSQHSGIFTDYSYFNHSSFSNDAVAANHQYP